MTVNFLLQTVNGVVVILTTLALLFLLLYVLEPRHRRGTWWYDILHPLPGPALAQPMIVIKLGWLLTRAPIWLWRMFTGGAETGFSVYIQYCIVAGAVVSSIGFVWLIKLISRGRYGHWPWQMSSALITVYALASFAITFGPEYF